MRETNSSATGRNNNLISFQRELATIAMTSLVSSFEDNPIIKKQDVSIALQDYTSEDGYRIRFVLRNREKVFWCYSNKQVRDKELKRVYYELLD